MSVVSLVCAIDEDRGLGKNNQLLCHVPADLAYFKKLTLGKPVIMGRKTYQSMGRLLPGRWNIILTRQDLYIDGATTTSSLEHALELTAHCAEVMVIGGADVFQAAWHLASQLYVTVIHHHFEADVFFPKIDSAVWQCTEAHNRLKDDKNAYDLTFKHYERKFL